MRFGYPGKLATSVRGRLKRLAGGATPAELQLGHDVSAEQCIALLSHLDAHWYQLPRGAARTRARRELELGAGGVQAAYFRVGGRTFDRQDPLGRLSFQGAQHLQTLGALTDYDRNKDEAERNWPWERWQGSYEWREAQLIAPRGRRSTAGSSTSWSSCATTSARACGYVIARRASTAAASSRCR